MLMLMPKKFYTVIRLALFFSLIIKHLWWKEWVGVFFYFLFLSPCRNDLYFVCIINEHNVSKNIVFTQKYKCIVQKYGKQLLYKFFKFHQDIFILTRLNNFYFTRYFESLWNVFEYEMGRFWDLLYVGKNSFWARKKHQNN